MNIISIIIIILLGVLIIIIGLCTLSINLWQKINVIDESKWVYGKNIGQVITSNISSQLTNNSSNELEYKPIIVFNFNVGDIKYIGREIGEFVEDTSRDGVHEFINKYPNGKTVDVIYYKFNPNISYLKYGRDKSLIIPSFVCMSSYVCGLFMIIIGTYLFINN